MASETGEGVLARPVTSAAAEVATCGLGRASRGLSNWFDRFSSVRLAVPS